LCLICSMHQAQGGWGWVGVGGAGCEWWGWEVGWGEGGVATPLFGREGGVGREGVEGG
jgi:hypothetical protein